MTILTNEQLTKMVIELGQRLHELESKGKRNVFKAPTVDDVYLYMNERGYFNSNVECSKFVDFYESKGWLVGKTKMKDWKASVRQWISRNNERQAIAPVPQQTQRQQVRTALRDINGTDW